MALPTRIRLTSKEQAATLHDAAIVLLDTELDECRELFTNSGAFVNVTEVNPHMRRAVAIQEMLVLLKKDIPHASHEHPTIIPLTPIQAEVVDKMIEFAFDIADDTATDPIFGIEKRPVTKESVVALRKELDKSLDRLVAAAELKAVWLSAKVGH